MSTPGWFTDELAHAGGEHLNPTYVPGYDRKAVRRAVSEAVKNIARRNEPALTGMLAPWEASPRTRDAAGRFSEPRPA